MFDNPLKLRQKRIYANTMRQEITQDLEKLSIELLILQKYNPSIGFA